MRLIEIPDDGIISIPIMNGYDTIGHRLIDLEDMPTIYLVRCRECKYHNKQPCPMRLSLNWTEDYDFCSYGEREEGAD